jgi:hypothetical protein
MSLIVATWPNNSVSLLRSPAEWDAAWLFGALDIEANPFAAKVMVVKGRYPHVGWTEEVDEETGRTVLTPYAIEGTLIPWSWPDDMTEQWRAYHRERAAAQ